MFQAAVRVVFRAFFIIVLLTSQSLVAAETPQPKGSLVIIGGALRSDNAAVWERMVQLAGGKGARIAVFASASANPDKAGKALVERFNHYGARRAGAATSSCSWHRARPGRRSSGASSRRSRRCPCRMTGG